MRFQTRLPACFKHTSVSGFDNRSCRNICDLHFDVTNTDTDHSQIQTKSLNIYLIILFILFKMNTVKPNDENR